MRPKWKNRLTIEPKKITTAIALKNKFKYKNHFEKILIRN